MKEKTNSRRRSNSLYAGIVLTTTILLCSCAGDLSEAELFERAETSYENGDLASSIIDLKNALKSNPQNSDARVMLGRIYLESGNSPSAEKELRRAIELGFPVDPILVPLAQALLEQGKLTTLLEEMTISNTMSGAQQAELHLLRGKAYSMEGEFFEASNEFEAAMTASSDSTAAWEGQALLAMSQQQWDEARTWIVKILEKQPTATLIWQLLGDLERIVGDEAQAEVAYTKAIDLPPAPIETLLKRALVRVALGNYADAEKDAKSAKKAAPKSAETNYVMGVVHFNLKQYAQAQQDFEQSLRSNPDHAFAQYYLGASHFAQNQLNQADQYLSRFLRHYPQSREAALMLAGVRMSASNPVSAESILKPIMESGPNDPYLHRLLGNVYLSQGKNAEGIEQLRQALALKPDAITQTQLGLGLIAEGNQQEGVAALEAVLNMETDTHQLELSVTLGLLQAQEYDKAFASIEQLAEKNPDHALPPSLRGAVYMLKDDAPNARIHLTQGLEVTQGYPLAGLLLARLEERQGSPDKAEILYEQVLEHNPGHLVALMQFSAWSGRQGQPQQARAKLLEAIDSNPDALEPRLLMGNYYLFIGKPAQALEITRPAEAAHSQSAQLQTIMGRATLANGNPASAITHFEALTKIDSTSAQARYLLAQAYVSANNPRDARQALEEAIKLDPEHGLSKIALARLSMLEDRPKEANTLLQQLQGSFPDHPEILNLEGWLAMQQGKPAVAAVAYREAQLRSPSTRNTVQLAQAQWGAGDHQGSIATLESWLEQHPSDLLAKFTLGENYLALNQNDKAIPLYESVTELDPTSAVAHNNLAWLLRTEQPAKALQHAERALELAPSNPAILDTAAMNYLEKGDTEQALELLRKALVEDPKNLEIRYHLALALQRNGEKAKAREVLENLSLDNASPQLKKDISSLLAALGAQ